MFSVEEAMDLASHEPLCDWKGLKANVHFPNYYKFLQSSMFPPKLVTYFTVERLESACYICAAFLRAHRIARQQLHDFIGNCLPHQFCLLIFLILFPVFTFLIISIPFCFFSRTSCVLSCITKTSNHRDNHQVYKICNRYSATTMNLKNAEKRESN